jgi:negative regulator of sigma E activity
MDLEERLKDAFAREEAPAGFDRAVLARVRTGGAASLTRRGRFFAWLRTGAARWVAVTATACFLLGMGVGRYVEYRHQAAQAEAAKLQVIQALRVASERLNAVQRILQDAQSNPEAPAAPAARH